MESHSRVLKAAMPAFGGRRWLTRAGLRSVSMISAVGYPSPRCLRIIFCIIDSHVIADQIPIDLLFAIQLFWGSSRNPSYDHCSEIVVCIFIRIPVMKSMLLMMIMMMMMMKDQIKRVFLPDIYMLNALL